MKVLLRQLFQVIVFGLLIPSMLFSGADKNCINPLPDGPPGPNVSASTIPSTKPVQEVKPVYIGVMEDDGKVVQMELEEYVCGVVLGEMPASFDEEALKAQAVAARTYALRCELDKVHESAAVCKSHTCCQNYCDPDAYVSSGGRKSNLDKVKDAVQATKGMVAVYNDKPIFAAYFASSGGMTEDAVAVWGRSFPYLQSVESPNEQDHAYQDYKLTMTAESFQKKLGGKLTGCPKDWFGKVTYTDGGGVATMEIGGRVYTGVKLRSLLGLRSTCFTVTATDTAVCIVSNGYGHRVGMSQYGAEAMALSGKKWEQIICHYYAGVRLCQYPFSHD